uniref:Transporter n=1 Tax=Magallana gigas TaxID=29159 RepID=A0A8W8MSH7_MAGGI
MSLLGYSVGLGTVWRFPYLAYSNGGGTFVFTFVLMFFLLGLPVMFLELALGQYSGLGQSVMFDRLCPLFHGIDYGMISVSGIVSLYYTVIIAWCIMYFFASITGELPWTKCDTEWATENCYSFKEADLCHQVSGQVYYKTVCYDATVSFERNLSLLTRNVTRHPSAKDFFERGVLHQSDGIGNIGVPQWKIMICLILAWFMPFAIFYFFHKGFKLKKKVGYFNILFHNVVLIILFSHGVTLPGAVDGIIYYLTPRFDKLGEAKVWSDAASQILFALGPAWGCLNTLSRYNHFHNNCFKDTLIVGIGNILNSLFAGVVVFSLIGYLAHDFQMPIDKVMDQGAGLPFIVYTDVLTRFSISPLFSVLVFVMMIILGMGSECALLETMTTAAQDTYPQLRVKKTYFFAVVCLIGFIGSLPVTCNFIFVFNFIQYKPMEFGDSDHLIFSNWIGWILSLVPIILILTFAIIKILKAPKEMHFRELHHQLLLKPSLFWDPARKVQTFDVYESNDGISSFPSFISTVIPNFVSRDLKV